MSYSKSKVCALHSARNRPEIALNTLTDVLHPKEGENVIPNAEFYIGTPRGEFGTNLKLPISDSSQPRKLYPTVFDRLYGHGMSQKAARDAFALSDTPRTIKCSIQSPRNAVFGSTGKVSMPRPVSGPSTMMTGVCGGNVAKLETVVIPPKLVENEVKRDFVIKGILKNLIGVSRGTYAGKEARRLNYTAPRIYTTARLTTKTASKKRRVTFQIDDQMAASDQLDLRSAMDSTEFSHAVIQASLLLDESSQTDSVDISVDSILSTPQAQINEWGTACQSSRLTINPNSSSLDIASLQNDPDKPRTSQEVFHFLAKSLSKSQERTWRINFDEKRNLLSILPFTRSQKVDCLQK